MLDYNKMLEDTLLTTSIALHVYIKGFIVKEQITGNDLTVLLFITVHGESATNGVYN